MDSWAFLVKLLSDYRKISNLRHTQSQNLNDSRLLLHLSYPNIEAKC